MKEIPRQLKWASDAKLLNDIGVMVSVQSTGACAFHFIFNLIMNTSLNSLWSMLNNQQIIVHIPLFERLKFPPNAMIIMEYMIKLANFDVVPTEKLDD